MKKILCPVDLLPASQNAMDYCGHLARHFDARLILIHIVEKLDRLDYIGDDSGYKEAIGLKEDATRSKILKYSQALEQEFDIECEILVKSSNSKLENVLKKELARDAYDLVVMGTNGAEDLNQFFFGTHTYRVLREIKSPLLMVPEECPFTIPREVVYAMDYGHNDKENLRKLMLFAIGFHSRITALHISQKPTFVSEEIFSSIKNVLDDELENPKLYFKRVIEEDIAIGIDNFMMEEPADLLVLSTTNYNLLDKLLHRSTVKQISVIAKYPVLIYHE